jgi:citrate lyase subunit alpha/citrate CoA-transferase
LLANLQASNLPLMDIADLQHKAYSMTGVPQPVAPTTDEIVGVVEYRDGTIIDVLRKPR